VEMLNKGRAYKKELENRTCSRIEENAEDFNTWWSTSVTML